MIEECDTMIKERIDALKRGSDAALFFTKRKKSASRSVSTRRLKLTVRRLFTFYRRQTLYTEFHSPGGGALTSHSPIFTACYTRLFTFYVPGKPQNGTSSIPLASEGKAGPRSSCIVEGCCFCGARCPPRCPPP